MGGCTALGSGCTAKARLHTAGEAEAAEPGTHNGAPREGEGRDSCSEAGSLGAGMVGAREGQKRGRKGRTQALASVEDGGVNEDIDA